MAAARSSSALATALWALEATCPRERVAADPVQFPRRYTDPRDVEVAGLVAASLAYGQARLFVPKVAAVLEALGPSPARALLAVDVPGLVAVSRGFVYRFNVATDLAVLLGGVGQVLRRYGSLESLFVQLLDHLPLKRAFPSFSRAIRDAAPRPALARALGPERGLDHLLPVGDGPFKRHNLFLRWMVRGPDAIDLGVWKRVPAHALVVPLDTHVLRVAQHLGLTRRTSASWACAEEITRGLRTASPDDPVRFDFALCHLGMSGACPLRPVPQACRRCPLKSCCRTGARLLRRR